MKRAFPRTLVAAALLAVSGALVVPAASAAEARALDRALRASPEQPVTPITTRKQAPKAKERRKEENITENRVK